MANEASSVLTFCSKALIDLFFRTNTFQKTSLCFPVEKWKRLRYKIWTQNFDDTNRTFTLSPASYKTSIRENGSGELNWLRTRSHQILCQNRYNISKCSSLYHCISRECSDHCFSLKTAVIASSGIKAFVWLPRLYWSLCWYYYTPSFR